VSYSFYSPKRRSIFNRLRNEAWVTYAIAGFTTLVFIAQFLSELITGYDWPAVWGIKQNTLIVVYHQYWRLITPVFLHAGLLHIGLNLWGLFVLGPTLEKLIGHWRFALLYFIAAYTGNVMSLAFTKAPSLGASTAIFGLLGAYLVIFYMNQPYLGEAARSTVTQALFWILVNLVWSLQSGIDMWGHIGGLLGGMMFSVGGGPLWSDIGGKVYDYGAVYFALRDHRPYRSVILSAVATVVLFTIVAIVRYRVQM